MTIALCFLTIGDLSQPALWESFLAHGGSANVYSHPKNVNAVTTPFLRGGIISERVPTAHGDVSLVNATLNLFRAAFADERNSHFILLSETTIPIVALAEVERQLADAGDQSLIAYDIAKPGTEPFIRQRQLAPGCVFEPFFKHDQWVILSRRHVALLLEKPLLGRFRQMFAADEHYFLNVLAHHAGVKPEEVLNRCTTFVNWRDSEVRETRGADGSLVARSVHPKTYTVLPSEHLRAARQSGCWFFRKVSSDCDVSMVQTLVG